MHGNKLGVKTNHQRKVMRRRRTLVECNQSIAEKTRISKTLGKTPEDLPLPQTDNVKKLPNTASYPLVASNKEHALVQFHL
jgi:hypothetical protein